MLRLFILVFIIACSGSGENENTRTVQVTTDSGSYLFNVEVADTPSERATGLMNRDSLASDAGMFFVWDEDVNTSFWMKDTSISLDILFINADLSIVSITENSTPYSEELITSSESFRYVLEVNAGFVSSSGAKVGDRVVLNI